MISEEITKELYRLQDEKYRDFQGSLIPTVDRENIIGVRTPALRKYAKQLAKESDIRLFLDALPHKYFDENQLHAFIISEIKDFETCVKEVQRFLPYVDNWATCDQLTPKVFSKNHRKLLPYIKAWIKSGKCYTIRFGIKMLMSHFLDDDFKPEYPEIIANIKSDEYYVNMMRAWYFSTALAKRYDEILPYIENHCLDEWTHKKTIQKAVESYRISEAQKQFLRQMR